MRDSFVEEINNGQVWKMGQFFFFQVWKCIVFLKWIKKESEMWDYFSLNYNKWEFKADWIDSNFDCDYSNFSKSSEFDRISLFFSLNFCTFWKKIGFN